MKNFLFLALLSLSSKSFAHDFSSQLGNDISSTDYIYISCDNLADKIHVELSGNKSAGSPIISAQIFKDTKAKNITSQGNNIVDFQGGGGAYQMTINKNKTAIAPTYTIKNIKAKNSIFNTNNKILPKKKTKINNKIECIGFIIPITKVAHVKQQALNIYTKNCIFNRDSAI